MSTNSEDSLPPASQSHFSKFENFTPDENASFDHEFARLASSQTWVPGSQMYTRERTIAMRQELKLHYFSQPRPLHDTNEELTEEEKLQGYQELCHEVRIPPSDSIAECKKHLKNTLVNIVDLIDARRTRKAVKVWHDFEAFRAYTLKDEHRIIATVGEVMVAEHDMNSRHDVAEETEAVTRRQHMRRLHCAARQPA
ncbi:hypothetical protein CDV31_017174 [Fusarium ambrosium]|uniref:Uncharacterized protein n=1 Tax=Fusarium ambrosium TaxID=131363 RepID=A0A428RQG5_9HYPO|nr:hypothetical protein CDV31_017174 [Fusarium ambrosium]